MTEWPGRIGQFRVEIEEAQQVAVGLAVPQPRHVSESLARRWRSRLLSRPAVRAHHPEAGAIATQPFGVDLACLASRQAERMGQAIGAVAGAHSVRADPQPVEKGALVTGNPQLALGALDRGKIAAQPLDVGDAALLRVKGQPQVGLWRLCCRSRHMSHDPPSLVPACIDARARRSLYTAG